MKNLALVSIVFFLLFAPVYAVDIPPGAPRMLTASMMESPDSSGFLAEEAFDLKKEMVKALGIKTKPGMEGLKQERDLGLLMVTVSNLRNIETALDMYCTDNKSKYPASLASLTPKYMKNIPRCLSSKGDSEYAYTPPASGKGYSISCMKAMFSMFNIPEGYPRLLQDSGVVLKPGVPLPESPERMAEELFHRGIKDYKEIKRTKDAKRAKAAREKIKASIATGHLDPHLKKDAEYFIKEYEKIEKQGKKAK
jgi:hypothetical protein